MVAFSSEPLEDEVQRSGSLGTGGEPRRGYRPTAIKLGFELDPQVGPDTFDRDDLTPIDRRSRHPPVKSPWRRRHRTGRGPGSTNRSMSPARWKSPMTCAPPSTINARRRRRPDVRAGVDWPVPGQTGLDPGVGHRRAEHHLDLAPVECLWRGQSRTVSAGSSLRTVRAPTRIASLSARSRWASKTGFGPVIHCERRRCRPAIEAGGKLGDHEWRPVRRWWRYGASCSATRSAPTPALTSSPPPERADALAGDDGRITDPDDDPSNADSTRA